MSIIDKVEVDGTIYDIVGGGILPHLVISTDSGLTVTVTKGTTIITATETSESIYECDVTEFGTYTISDTENMIDVVIDTVTIYQLSMTPLVPDGETVLPTGDVTTWLECAGIKDKSYTTLSQVLSDSITFNALLGDSNANAYLARSTTWATTLCASQYAMNLIGQYDVCCDALIANNTWLSAIASSSYADYVLNTTVPTMTDATHPSGEVSASSTLSASYMPYMAFNPSETNGWSPNNAIGDHIIYEFPSAVRVSIIEGCAAKNHGSSSTRTATYHLSASNDGTNFTDLNTEITVNLDKVVIPKVRATVPNPDSYKYYKLTVTSGNAQANGGVKLQFYGHKDTGSYIHGANNEVAYYLDGATQTPISNPSTLDAGTYTFGSTIAKNPDSLSSDYTKSIRITPNTVEVVLRPDNALYWWGYVGGNCEDTSAANGWTLISGYSWKAPTYNLRDIEINSVGSVLLSGIGNKNAVSTTSIYVIGQGVTAIGGLAGIYGEEFGFESKNMNGTRLFDKYQNSTSLTLYTQTYTGASVYIPTVSYNGGVIKVSAFWYE